MSVIVTGAAGHVGGVLIRELLERGRDVKALVREDTRAIDGLDVECIKGDLRDLESLKRAFSGTDVVFHSAALISINGPQRGLVHQTNVEGVGNVIAACRATSVGRLVHLSSVHAFAQKPLDQPIDEERALVGDKGYAYDCSKAAGQRLVLEAAAQGLDAVIVHPAAVLGPYDFKPSRMGQVLIDIYNSDIPSLVAGGFNWVDVRDVVAGVLLAEERGRTGRNYILSGSWRPLTALAKMVGAVTGRKVPSWACPMALARFAAPFAEGYAKLARRTPLFTREGLGALRANRHMSHERAKKELGYAPRPTQETIADLFTWLADTGRIG